MKQEKQKVMLGPRFYNRAGLCEVMELGMTTVDKLLRRAVNPIPSMKVGHTILVPCDQFDAWVAAESAKGHAGWER